MEIKSESLEVLLCEATMWEALAEIERRYSGFVMVIPHCAGGYDFANKGALPPELPIFKTVYKDQVEGEPSADVMLKMLREHGYSTATARHYPSSTSRILES